MMRRSFPLLLVEVACCAATACTSENADAYATGVELPCCAGLEMELKDWNGDKNWFYKCTSRHSCPHDVAVVQSWSDESMHLYSVGVMTILDVENNVSLGTLTHPTPGEMGEFNYYYYAGDPHPPVFSARIASSGKIVTADRGREVGIIWSATGTKLKEIPRFVMADETYVVRTGYRGEDEEPSNWTTWWPPIEAAHVFSPDGNRLLGKNDGNPTIVNILDMESMESLCELTHDGPVRVASFDSAGLRVLTVEKSGDVTTWNASDCRIVARIPYGGNQSHWTDSVAWVANGRLVAMIETDSWSENVTFPYNNPPWRIRVHLPRRLVLFEATTGQQVHSASLTQDTSSCYHECAPLIYARGEIILVNIRYHSADLAYADAAYSHKVGGGPYMADVTIFNASNGAMLQDFTQRHWNKLGAHMGLHMMDVDLQGEHLLVSEQKLRKQYKHRIPDYSISREIWDVATGNLSRALRPYNHSEAKGFVGAGRLTVNKELHHLSGWPDRTQIVDLETEKQIASSLGKQKAYATVTTCDDRFVVV